MTSTLGQELRIEDYFERYRDVSGEVILKEDILRLGLKFTEAALTRAKDHRIKSYYLFSFDRISHDEMQKRESARVPEDIRFSKGQYGLRPTIVRVINSAETKYSIDVIDDQLMLLEHGVPIANVEYPPNLRSCQTTFEDGVTYNQVVARLFFNSIAFLTNYRICQYWGPKEECKFCDINNNVRALRKVRGPLEVPKAFKDAQQVATVIEAYYREETDPGSRMLTIIMTGGTITSKVNGRNYVDFNVEYVTAVRERIGSRLPFVVIMEAQKKDDVKRLWEAGASTYNPNIEVWDKRLFQQLCPGKDKLIGRDEWIRRTIDAVEVFGEGNVSPNMVAGVEMAQPHGFKTVREAVESTTEGFDYLMAHGVVPHLDSWCIEPGSALAGREPLPLEYFVEIDRAWYETWTKHKLPLNSGWGPMGPGHATYGNSGYIDMGNR
ncbi:MAG: radical SAM protein [Gemmatimonadetes bacterium]|nr:radical SAM protein [Gemmatimonadota bacterium]